MEAEAQDRMRSFPVRLWMLSFTAAFAIWLALPPAGYATRGSHATGWKSYRSAQGGFSITYPRTWTVHPHQFSSATLDVAFLPPGRSTGVTAVSRPPFPRYVTEPWQMPGMRCHDVTAHGLSGMYCVNSTSGIAITTFQIPLKAFTVTASLRHIKASIYGHMVRSFRLLG